MGPSDKERIIKNACEDVLKRYSTETQLDLFKTIIEREKMRKYLGENGAICYLIHSGFLGGAENHILKHALIAKENGLSVLVCIPTYFKDMGEEVERICKENNIRIEFLNYSINGDTNSMLQRDSYNYESEQLRSLIEKNNVKLIHSVTLIPAAEIAAKKCKIPHVASLHQVYEDRISREYIEILPKYVHSSSLRYAKIWAEKIGAITKCIRSHIPEKFFTKEAFTQAKKDEINIVVSGTIQQRKGQDKVIEAVGKLIKKGYKLNLFLFGYDQFFPDYINLCKDIIKKYDIEQRVCIKGFCRNIIEALKNMDILVCGSDSESFPQVIYEAMAMGIIVISTPVGGVTELITNGLNGYISTGYEASDIEKAIESFLKDYTEAPNKLIDLKKSAYETVYHECNKDHVASELFRLYNRAIDDNNMILLGGK